jgi:hypothetical protein
MRPSIRPFKPSLPHTAHTPLSLLQCASAKTSSGNILCDGWPDEMWTSPAGSQGMMDGWTAGYVTADTGLIQSRSIDQLHQSDFTSPEHVNSMAASCMHAQRRLVLPERR